MVIYTVKHFLGKFFVAFVGAVILGCCVNAIRVTKNGGAV